MRKNLMAGLGALALLVVGGLLYEGDASAASLTTRVEIAVVPSLSGTAGLLTPSASGTIGTTYTLANGTGLNQADQLYVNTYSITTGATEDIDVQGSLTDVLGAAFTPAKLKLVYIYSRSSNTTDLTILGDANSVPILSAAATTATLTPGDPFVMSNRSAAGWAVTAGTGDIIQITNGAGATAVVDVVLVGGSS